MEYQTGTYSCCITGVPAVTRDRLSVNWGLWGKVVNEWVRGMTSFLLLTTTPIYKKEQSSVDEF